MDVKLLLSGFALLAAFSFVSATPLCALEHDMPDGAWLYQAWLCVSNQDHGWIYSIAPLGIPSGGRMFKVELQTFTYSSPYPATLNCYEQFTDVEPPGRMGGKSGLLNSVPPGPSYSWHLERTVTLNAGEFTPNTGTWAQYGCPPIMNYAQQPGNPAQVLIYVAWNYWFPPGRSTVTPFAPFLAFNPTASTPDGAVSSNDGAIAWANKFVKRKAFKR